MIWLDSINRQIEKADPKKKYTWGIEVGEGGDLRLVCLFRLDTDDLEKVVRLSRNLDDYGLSVMQRKRFVLEMIEEMEEKI